MPESQLMAFTRSRGLNLKQIADWWSSLGFADAPGSIPIVALKANGDLNDADLPASQDAPVAILTSEGQTSTDRAKAAALVALATNSNSQDLVGTSHTPDGLLDFDTWMTKCASIRDEICELRQLPDPESALGEPFDGAISVILERAQRHQLTLLDGEIAAAAGLYSTLRTPEAIHYVRPLHLGCSPTEDKVRVALGKPALVQLNSDEDGLSSHGLAHLATRTIAIALESNSNLSDD